MVNIFWAAHITHHSEEFNLSTAMRQASTGFYFKWVFYLPWRFLAFLLKFMSLLACRFGINSGCIPA